MLINYYSFQKINLEHGFPFFWDALYSSSILNYAAFSFSDGRISRDVGGNSGTPIPEAYSFMRTASGGVFEVEGYLPGLDIDMLPPSKIKDFHSVGKTYDENRTVELIWTAVGDDFDQGIGTASPAPPFTFSWR